MQPTKSILSSEISRALNLSTPIVALESTVITHGLPRPQNLELARDMEAEIRKGGATPATIAVLNGEIRIGLSDEELVRLSEAESPLKVSHRDFATAIVKKASGGTTVAGTMFAAHNAEIQCAFGYAEGDRRVCTGSLEGGHEDGGPRSESCPYNGSNSKVRDGAGNRQSICRGDRK